MEVKVFRPGRPGMGPTSENEQRAVAAAEAFLGAAMSLLGDGVHPNAVVSGLASALISLDERICEAGEHESPLPPYLRVLADRIEAGSLDEFLKTEGSA